MRQPLAEALLTNGPDGTPDEFGHFPDRDRLAQKLINQRFPVAAFLG